MQTISTYQYIDQLHKSFIQHANSEKASSMANYMMNKFAFYGVDAVKRKQLIQEFKLKYGEPTPENINEIVKLLWLKPERELHYVAMNFLNNRLFLKSSNIKPLIEFIITNNSWWDSVDFIASNIAGSWFKNFPSQTKIITKKWIMSNNIWLQRSALLFQLKYKEKTDTALLFNYINIVKENNDFFIKKAIGWALRELSKTNKESVINFVSKNQISNLSKKEALKIIIKNNETN